MNRKDRKWTKRCKISFKKKKGGGRWVLYSSLIEEDDLKSPKLS
jgi:hypothetical protein